MAHARRLTTIVMSLAFLVLSLTPATAKDADELDFTGDAEDGRYIKATVPEPAVGILYAVARMDAHEGIKSTCKTGFPKEGYQGNEGLCGAVLARDALKSLQAMVGRFKCSDGSEKSVAYFIGHRSYWPDADRAPIVFAETSEVTCEENPGLVTRGVLSGKADQWEKQCSQNNCFAVFKNSKTRRAYFHVPTMLGAEVIQKIDLGDE